MQRSNPEKIFSNCLAKAETLITEKSFTKAEAMLNLADHYWSQAGNLHEDFYFTKARLKVAQTLAADFSKDQSPEFPDPLAAIKRLSSDSRKSEAGVRLKGEAILASIFFKATLAGQKDPQKAYVAKREAQAYIKLDKKHYSSAEARAPVKAIVKQNWPRVNRNYFKFYFNSANVDSIPEQSQFNDFAEGLDKSFAPNANRFAVMQPFIKKINAASFPPERAAEAWALLAFVFAKANPSQLSLLEKSSITYLTWCFDLIQSLKMENLLQSFTEQALAKSKPSPKILLALYKTLRNDPKQTQIALLLAALRVAESTMTAEEKDFFEFLKDLDLRRSDKPYKPSTKFPFKINIYSKPQTAHVFDENYSQSLPDIGFFTAKLRLYPAMQAWKIRLCELADRIKPNQHELHSATMMPLDMLIIGLMSLTQNHQDEDPYPNDEEMRWIATQLNWLFEMDFIRTRAFELNVKLKAQGFTEEPFLELLVSLYRAKTLTDVVSTLAQIETASVKLTKPDQELEKSLDDFIAQAKTLVQQGLNETPSSSPNLR